MPGRTRRRGQGRLRLGVPQALNNVLRLAALRRDLGPAQFTELLTQAAGSTGLAETILSLLDHMEEADSSAS